MSSKKKDATVASDTTANGQPPVSEVSRAELDKVRSILFGDAYKELRQNYVEIREDTDKRFDALKQDLTDRLDREIDAVRTEALRSFDALTASIDSEGSTLSATIDALSDRVADANRGQRDALAKVEEDFSERTNLQSEHLDTTAAAIRKESSEMQRDLSARLDAAVGGLSKGKTDRRQLADLFENLAATLRADS